MITKVASERKPYVSHVFFTSTYEYRPYAVVFCDEEDRFVFVGISDTDNHSKRMLYDYDDSTEGMVQKDKIALSSFTVKNCVGYDWLINDPQLLKDIEQGKEVPEKYLAIGREMNASIDLYAWHEVETEADAEALMDACGACHDSYIRDFRGFFGRPFEPEEVTGLRVAFELGCHFYDVELEFEEDVSVRYDFCTNLNFIYLSSLFFHEGKIYWLEGSDEYSPADIPRTSHICAKKLRWRILDKMEH